MKQVRLFVVSLIAVVTFLGIVSVNGVEATDSVKVGSVMATQGIIKEIYFSVNDGLKDCFAIANDEGGINGKKIEYIVKETHYEDVDECVKAVDQIWSEEHPLIIMGCSTPLAYQVAPKMAEHYKTLFCSHLHVGKAGPAGITLPCSSQAQPTVTKWSLSSSTFQKPTKNARIAFSTATQSGARSYQICKTLVVRLGTNVVNEVVVDLKNPDVKGAASKLKESNPDYVICQGFAMGSNTSSQLNNVQILECEPSSWVHSGLPPERSYANWAPWPTPIS